MAKKVHFNYGKGSIACPILRAAEYGCFDTLSSDDPFDITCRKCTASPAYVAARKAARRVKPAPAVEELALIRATLELTYAGHLTEHPKEPWAISYRAGLAVAAALIRKRVEKIRRDNP